MTHRSRLVEVGNGLSVTKSAIRPEKMELGHA